MLTASLVRRSLPALYACSLVLLPWPASAAEDSAFLACERFSDRGQRIACLEDALEAATVDADAAAPAPAVPAAPAAPQAAPRAAAPAPAPAPPAVAEAPAAPDAAAAGDAERESPSLMERLRNFGRDDSATLSTDADGQEQLHDTIAALEKRRDDWIVTLASGQVWMQDYPRALNLRVGDKVTIYQAGVGNGYRLSTDRLSGFIRVRRVR